MTVWDHKKSPVSPMGSQNFRMDLPLPGKSVNPLPSAGVPPYQTVPFRNSSAYHDHFSSITDQRQEAPQHQEITRDQHGGSRGGRGYKLLHGAGSYAAFHLSSETWASEFLYTRT